MEPSPRLIESPIQSIIGSKRELLEDPENEVVEDPEEEKELEQDESDEENEDDEGSEYSFTYELHIGKGAEESYDEVGGLIDFSIKKDPNNSKLKRQEKLTMNLLDLLSVIAYNAVLTCGKTLSIKDIHIALATHFKDALDNLETDKYFKEHLFDHFSVLKLGKGPEAWPDFLLKQVINYYLK